MKKLFLTLFPLMAFVSVIAQETKTELKTRFDVIRNETVAGANSKTRLANAYQKLADATQSIYYLNASGTNTYSATALNIDNYSGKYFIVKFANANTDSATLNINSLGAVTLKKDAGENLVAGDIDAGDVHVLAYDGTNFQLLSLSAGGSWGSITGSLSSQSDLQTALNGKANTATTLSGYGITNAWDTGTGAALTADNVISGSFALNFTNTINNFNSSTLALFNPGGTFKYTFVGGALSANRNVTFPALSGNDEFTFNDQAQTITNKTLGAFTTISASPTINDGIKLVFNPDGTNAGLNFGANSTDPSSLTNGDTWYNSTTNLFRARAGGSSNNFILGTMTAGRVQFASTAGVITDDADMTFATDRLTLTNLTLTGGIGSNGGGLKHGRTSTGSISAGASALVTITWGTAFANANYTVTVDVEDATASATSLRVVHIESKTASAITVRVENTSGGALTGTVNAIAIHD